MSKNRSFRTVCGGVSHSVETDQVSLSPIPGGALATNGIDLVVRTNVETGYQLALQDQDTNTALVKTDDPEKTIPTLENSTNADNFPEDHWGYSVGLFNENDSVFKPIPASGEPDIIAESDSLVPGEGETTELTFGAKLSSGVANGEYEDIVMFTASPKLVASRYYLTITYQYDDGAEAAPKYTKQYAPGDPYEVTSPVADKEGYYPSQDVVKGTMVDHNVDVVVTYSQYRTVTVNFVDEDGGQFQVNGKYSIVEDGYKKGDTYNITIPQVEGYYTNETTISGTIEDENVVKTVTYHPYYTATIYYVEEGDTSHNLFPSESQTMLKPGSAYSFTRPAVDPEGYFYSGESGALSGEIVKGNVVLYVYYKKYYTATVKFVYEGGCNGVASLVQGNLKDGDQYNLTLPNVEGCYADPAGPITGSIEGTDFETTVTYKKYYSATVQFVYQDGCAGAESSVQNNLVNGSSFEIPVPTIAGCYADNTGPITGTIENANFVTTVTYKKYWTMTIIYKNTNGETLRNNDTQGNLKAGEKYAVVPPAINGYTAEKAAYTGTVPNNDFTVEVVYGAAFWPNTDISTMQNMTQAACDKMPTPSASETNVPEAMLKDARDGKNYKIRKLADGRCWMVQDLNFLLSDDATTGTLNSTTTDLPAGTTWTPENSTQTETGVVWETPSVDIARSYTNGTRTYYNWRAATAGTTNASTTSGDAAGTVCPKGWTLPTSSEYKNLITTVYSPSNDSVGSAKLQSSPLDFVISGYYSYNTNQVASPGTGIYWTRTAYDGLTARDFTFFGSGSILPTNTGFRGNGIPVRCMLRNE